MASGPVRWKSVNQRESPMPPSGSGLTVFALGRAGGMTATSATSSCKIASKSSSPSRGSMVPIPRSPRRSASPFWLPIPTRAQVPQ
jgi:hypothetical protein